MKKTLALVLALALVSALCGMLFVSAEDANLAAGKEVANADKRSSYYADLTDGVALDSLTYEATDWFGYYWNPTATPDQNAANDANATDGIAKPTIDLGAAYALSSVRVNLFEGSTSGITTPEYIKVLVSTDGSSYEEVAEKTYEWPEEGANSVAWAEIELPAGTTAQYVCLEIKMRTTFVFLNEIEIYGSEAAGDEPDPEPTPDPEPSEPTVVEEVITIDGKLDDTGYDKAVWFDKGVWQSIGDDKPVLEGIDIKYTTRSDAENIYLAVQVTDEVVLQTALNPDAWDQSGATNFRLWFLGDGMETRTFYDLLWDGEKLVPHRQKVATEELTYALGTDGGVLTLEVKIAKASLSISESYKMMVTYSAPDFGTGDIVGYNAFHMTEFVRGEDGALAEGWSGNDAMYVEYKDADVVLGTYEVEPEDPSDDPSDEPSDEPSKPVTPGGDAGILVFAVLGVVAVCGAAVTIKARG